MKIKHLLFLIPLLLAGISTWAQTIRYVPCGTNTPCYATIQAAITASSNGDFIEVDAGTYVIAAGTQLLINKQVTLRAKAGLSSKPIITTSYSSWTSCAVKIAANNIVIDGFEITSSLAINTNPNYLVGDYYSTSNNWTVKNCNIHQGYLGIFANGNNITIQGNEIHETWNDCINCEYGICDGLKVTQNWLHSEHTNSGTKPAGITYNCDATAVSNVEISYNYCNSCRTFIDFQHNGGTAPGNQILIMHNTVDWNLANLPSTPPPIPSGTIAQQMSIAFWTGSGNWNSLKFTIRDNIFSRQKWYAIVNTSGSVGPLVGSLNINNNLFYQWYLIDAYYPGSAYPNEWPSARGAVGWDVTDATPTFTNDILNNPLYVSSGTTASQYYSLSCGSPAINAASDGTNIGANQVVPPAPTVSVNIATPSSTVCPGTSVTYTATPANGGSTPAYQWKVNGNNAGTNSVTYAYIPLNGDHVTCVLTSSLSCSTGNPATSNTITMVVNASPTIFTGTGNWEDDVRWSNGIPATCKDVTIHGVCSITSASALCNTLTIDSSAQLTLNTGKTLTISTTFLIRSTGSYLDKGTTVVNPANITVQRYMTGNWTGGVPTTSTIFHYLSSPVSSATSGMFSGDQLYQYNELTHLWDLITSSIVMTPGIGYAAALSSNKVKSFTGGSLNSSDITITGLTLTGGVTDYSGYHLIGNPYPCSLLWDNTWAKTNLDATACIWDHTNGHYWYHNGITGNGPFANGIIPAEQAFYIKANADGGSITIPQAKRLHSTQTFYKKEEPVTLSLKLSGDDGYDESVIMFTQGSTVGFDHPFDCQKLWGNDAATEIFSWIDGTVPASINVLPDETNCPAIPIGIKVGNTGSYSIDVTGMGTFHDDIAIFLEDKLTGAMQNLRTNPGYTFNSSPQTPSDPNRFLVHFSPTGIGVMSGPSIRIFAIEKNVYVNISEKTQGTISIYNLLGEKIAEKDIAGNTKNIIPLDVTEGIYIVNIFANEFRKTGKVIIR